MGRFREWVRARVSNLISLDPGGWAIVRGEAPTHYQQTGKNVRILGWERNAVVQACARLIAETVASVPFEVYRLHENGDEEVIRKHPLLDLLTTPRVGMSGRRNTTLSLTHRLTYGNFLWELERKEGPTRPPSGLRLIHPENIIYVYLDRDTLELMVYEWRDRTGIMHLTHANDMLHVRDLAGGDWLFGYPRAAAALLDISSDNEATQYVRQVITNHGQPGVVVRVPESVANKQMRRAKARWNQEYIGRGGRGGVHFIRGVDEIIPMGFNLQELEFPNLRGIAREDICAAFGIDPRMVGIASARGTEGGLSGQQYSEAFKRFVAQCVRPEMDAVEAELNFQLTPEYGDVFVRFSREELRKLTLDDAEYSGRIINEFRGDLLTREEARMSLGRDPVPEAGQQFYSDLRASSLSALMLPPGGNGGGAVPGGETVKPQKLLGTGSEAHPPGLGKVGPTGPEQGSPGTPLKERAHPRVLSRSVVLNRAQRAALWKTFDARAVDEEKDYLRAAILQFEEERRGVNAVFDDHAPQRAARVQGGAAGEDPFVNAALSRVMSNYSPGGDYHQRWLDRYRALIGRTINAAAKGLADSVGFDFTLKNPAVLDAIDARARRLADFVTQETATQVSQAVALGQEQGLGVREIADLIDNLVFGGTAEMRATRIARTESIGALNQGEYLTAQDAGIFRDKEWLSQGDDRVRLEHEALDGVRIPIAGEFAPGLAHPGDQRAGPEQVINCRCTLLYYTGEE